MKKRTTRKNSRRPLVDVYLPTEVREWHSLQFSREQIGLELRKAGEASVGEAPSWWDEHDLESVCDVKDSGWEPPAWNWVDWGIAQGLAPGQPFLLRAWIEKDACQDYFGEWDGIEYGWEIALVEPLPPRYAVKRWTSFLRKVEVHLACYLCVKEELAELAKKNVGRYICSIHKDKWDRDMRCRGRLSNHMLRNATLEITSLSEQTALKKLQRRGCKANPRLSPDIIAELYKGRPLVT